MKVLRRLWPAPRLPPTPRGFHADRCSPEGHRDLPASPGPGPVSSPVSASGFGPPVGPAHPAFSKRGLTVIHGSPLPSPRTQVNEAAPMTRGPVAGVSRLRCAFTGQGALRGGPSPGHTAPSAVRAHQMLPRPCIRGFFFSETKGPPSGDVSLDVWRKHPSPEQLKMPSETNMHYAMFCMFYVKSFETHVSAEVGRRPALRRSRATPMRAPGQCGPSRSPNRFPSGPCGSWEAPRQLARGVGAAWGDHALLAAACPTPSSALCQPLPPVQSPGTGHPAPGFGRGTPGTPP